MKAGEHDIGDLCLHCGMCCDGSLFDFVPVTPDETGAVETAGFALSDCETGKGCAQPCQALSGTACTAYHKVRPRTCGTFFCPTANAVIAGELSLGDARGRIAKARSVQAQVAAYLTDGETLSGARRRWFGLDRQSIAGDDARFAVLMAALTRYLDQHFRYSHQIVMPLAGAPTDAGAPEAG